jgi:hypothetical protein
MPATYALNAQILRLLAAAGPARDDPGWSAPEKKRAPLRGKRRGARRPESMR